MKKVFLYAGSAILCWSSLATVSKLLLVTMNSYQMLCISALFAFAALLIVNVATGRIKKLKEYGIRVWVQSALIGLPGTFLYYVFLYLGTARMQASQAFIINYLWPIMSVVFACILLREKMTGRKIAALIVSFAGVFTVAGGDLIRMEEDMLIGALLCILAAISYGAFTAMQKKWVKEDSLSLMLAFLVTSLLSFVICLVQKTPWNIGWPQLLGLGWNGILVMAIATCAWAAALAKGETAKISNLAYITPFISLIWTFLILGEKPSIWSVAGLCLIVLGIFIQLKKKS